MACILFLHMEGRGGTVLCCQSSRLAGTTPKRMQLLPQVMMMILQDMQRHAHACAHVQHTKHPRLLSAQQHICPAQVTCSTAAAGHETTLDPRPTCFTPPESLMAITSRRVSWPRVSRQRRKLRPIRPKPAWSNSSRWNWIEFSQVMSETLPAVTPLHCCCVSCLAPLG